MSVSSDVDEKVKVDEGERVPPAWSRWLEPTMVAGTLPLALFAERLPTFVSWLVISGLAALWFLRFQRRNRRVAMDYVSLPMFALVLVFVPLSIWISPLSEVTVARSTLLLWCLSLFSWIANDTGSEPPAALMMIG